MCIVGGDLIGVMLGNSIEKSGAAMAFSCV
jgi:hypothetical protein